MTRTIDLKATIDRIRHGMGPTRVVVRTEGGHVAEATTPDLALGDYGIVADVALIRNDGWSLGARRRDLDAARKLWAGQWVAEVEC